MTAMMPMTLPCIIVAADCGMRRLCSSISDFITGEGSRQPAPADEDTTYVKLLMTIGNIKLQQGSDRQPSGHATEKVALHHRGPDRLRIVLSSFGALVMPQGHCCRCQAIAESTIVPCSTGRETDPKRIQFRNCISSCNLILDLAM